MKNFVQICLILIQFLFFSAVVFGQPTSNPGDPSLFEALCGSESSSQAGLSGDACLECNESPLSAIQKAAIATDQARAITLSDLLDYNNAKLKKIVETARKLKLEFNKKNPKCAHNVKKILYQAHAVNENLNAPFAYKMVENLKQKGFTNLLDENQPLARIQNPCLAPAGSVFVYNNNQIKKVNGKPSCIDETGAAPCGHTEVFLGAKKTKKNEIYYEAVYAAKPSPRIRTSQIGECKMTGEAGGDHYTLVGIMVPNEVVRSTTRVSSN